jgi:hypothetical protein
MLINKVTYLKVSRKFLGDGIFLDTSRCHGSQGDIDYVLGTETTRASGSHGSQLRPESGVTAHNDTHIYFKYIWTEGRGRGGEWFIVDFKGSKDFYHNFKKKQLMPL